MFSQWWRKTTARQHRRTPDLELLEDRTLPAAIITVNSTADTNLRDAVLTLQEAILINNRALNVAALTAAEKALVSGTPDAASTDTITFNIPADDPGHVYYRDDGVAGQVTLANVAATTEADDASIADIDPDWAHSWYAIDLAGPLPDVTETVVIDGTTQAGHRRQHQPGRPGAQLRAAHRGQRRERRRYVPRHDALRDRLGEQHGARPGPQPRDKSLWLCPRPRPGARPRRCPPGRQLRRHRRFGHPRGWATSSGPDRATTSLAGPRQMHAT